MLKEFSWEQKAEDMTALYERLLKRKDDTL